MNIDKKQLQKEIDSMIRTRKIFLFIAIGLFAVTFALSMAAFIIGFSDIGGDLYFYLAQLGGIFLMGALTMLILRSALFSFRINVRRAMIDGLITIDEKGQYVPVTDVKPVIENKELTREEELVKQYEELYEKGYISKEDLDAKRKEILK